LNYNALYVLTSTTIYHRSKRAKPCATSFFRITIFIGLELRKLAKIELLRMRGVCCQSADLNPFPYGSEIDSVTFARCSLRPIRSWRF
jgi:hypothetical protein